MISIKIRDAIRESLLSIHEEDDDFRDMIPMCFPEFVMNMSAILINSAHVLLQTNVYDISLFDEKFSGKAKRNPKVKDYIQVMNGADFLRHTNLFTQLWPFMSWLLNENEPDVPDDDNSEIVLWSSLSFLADKWNEYAQKENERINGKE